LYQSKGGYLCFEHDAKRKPLAKPSNKVTAMRQTRPKSEEDVTVKRFILKGEKKKVATIRGSGGRASFFARKGNRR